MAIKILFDANNRPIEPTLLLANKNGNILGLITNVSELRVTDNLTSVSRMSFKVTKYYDNQKCNVWDDLVDFKLVYCIEWDTWFEATLSLNESNEIIKIVDCAALSEAELSQTNLYGYEINTESDIAREDYKNPTIIYNPEDHSSSLIHRILTKAPHYTIKHIDATLARIQRTFSFDSISILDAFNRIAEEIGCIFIYGNESVKENGMRHPARTVSLYDLQQNCNDCGYRGEFTGVCPVCGSKNIKYGYGKDTTIFVNRDNLTDSIDFSVDTDSVKNCFRLEAGDDLMTATIINCNPNGTQYMWYISDAVKADMPKTLVDRINQYDKEYQFFNEKYQMNLSFSAINDYNRLVDKYLIYDSSIKKVPTSIVGYPSLMQSVYDVIDFEIILSESLMPKISMDKVTAQGQADLLTAASLSPVAVTNIKALSKTSADSNILAVAKIIVDSRYRVKIKESSFDTDSKVWVGNFSVTSYSDETDTAVSQTISVSITDDYEQYVKQKLDKALKKGDTTDYSISGIFKRDIIISGTNYGGDFVTTLQKYSLSMLEIIHDCCRGCIDVLIEQGISDRSKQSIETGNLYDKFYHNYYHRLKAIEKEMSVRQSEIDTIHTLMNEIEKERTKIQSQLNFQDYLGDENWKIFSSYRREDKYSNHNFISDGLNNTQLFNNALDFLGKAQEELYKSATLQHIISAPLKNLLVIKEFSPLVDYFEVGNWIRIEVDGEIFKLRLLNYSIDFDNLENIDVEFSDVCSTRSGISDLSSLYKKMTSISTSYDYYEKQAEKGSSSYETLNDFYLKGLDATLVKLVNNADDQDVVFDRHGMLFRQKDDVTNDFLPTQLKIVNSTLAVTNDNWETAKTGVGKFIYFDPRDRKYKEGFGIIADTLVGDVVLSSELGIFNDECSIALDKNGFTLTTNTIGKNVFTIQKETVDANGNKIYDRQLYINDNGDIVLGGGASISWDNVTGTDHVVTDVDAEKLKNDITAIFNQKINILEQQTDKKAETWYQADDPKVQWTTKEEKDKHNGDLWFNTTTSKSYIYNSASDNWEELKTTPPKEVFDAIDGKAQIFVEQPKVPYHVGDLWFDSSTSEIMTCVTERLSGIFTKSDWEKKNKYTDDSGLNHFVESVYNKEIEGLQAQIDGQIETHYYDYQPTLTNEPALSWETEQDKEKHIGDLFFWKSKGFAYRFLKDNTNYVWQLVKDTDVTTALENAQKAQDTADGKRRVFVSQPIPPYDIGDLWTQGKDGKLMRCKVAKASGTFASTDWEIAVGYTDDTALKDFLNGQYVQDKDLLKQQIDGKVQTFRQPNDPSVDWNTPELKNNHSGDLWYNTDTNETFMYNGNSWDAFTGEVPQELWDKVDGKAQIFTTTTPPTPPYHKGDLWFAGANADIKTCITTRESGSYVESDWKKYNKYTDDTKVDDVISGLGFTTSITGTKVISPHIVGGDLKIGNPNSGTYYASIDTLGKLTATGADIKGKIIATEGMIGNFNISNAIWNGMNSFNSGNNGVYLGTDGIALGGGKFKVTSGGKLTASGVDISGNINAESGIFRGTIYAQDGSFKGAITATSLTLLPGVTIDYGNISNKPEIPSVDRFISKDGIVGMTPSDGSTGFKVSSDGLLEASNAIIYGTIYASSGTIGGFNITSVKNDNDHAYGQTLYRQVKNVYENGSYYDYQAGIKGKNTSSSSTEATEAAFYIRKKLSSDTWANSTIPFYVRNNGYVYAENMNIGNTLYSTGVQRSESGLESKRYKVMESWVEKVAFGMLDKAYDNYATFDKTGTYLWSKGKAVKVVYDEYERYIELSPELDTTVAYLGNAFETWEKLYVQNIGDTGTPVNSGYFTNLYTKVNGVWTKVTGTSGGGTTAPTYTAGDGINISSNRISVTLAGEDSGGLKFNNYGNIAISTSFLNSRYSQINHTHSSSSITWSGLKSSNGDNNGHVHRGINNSSGYGLWINGSTMIYPASNADGGLNTTTVTDLNSGIDLGGRTVPFKGGYFKKLYLRNTDIESLFYLSVSGNTLYLKNNIDNSTISNVTLPSGGGGSSNYNDLNNKPSINNITLSGNKTLDNLGIGSKLSLYGTTLYLEKSNGSTISSVNLSSLSGGGGSSNTLTYGSYSVELVQDTDSGSTYRTLRPKSETMYLGDTYVPWQKLNCRKNPAIISDRRLKNNIISLSNDIQIENFYMEINPVSYYLNNDDENDKHFGFIAQEVSESLNNNGISSDKLGLITFHKFSKPTNDGLIEQYTMSYGEIIPLNTLMTQKAHHRIDTQEQEIQKLKNTILQLQGELSILKQKLGGN